MKAIKRTLSFILQHPFAKNHLARSFWRLVWWQIQLRFSSSKYIVKSFVGPVKFYAAKGLTGVTGNIYTGLHEFNDMFFLLHLLRSDDLFVDIGANVGSYTLLASGVCRAKTIAVEPIATAFTILTNNVLLNELQAWVNLINAAAGAAPGSVVFTMNEDTTNHVVTAAEKGQDNLVSVPLMTIDSLFTDQYPLLLKMDVEGFETEVLKGMSGTLNSPAFKAIIIELNGSGERYGFDENKIHELLISHHFKPYHYDPHERELTQASSFGNFNTIYCRDLDFINKRLVTAPSVKIMGEKI